MFPTRKAEFAAAGFHKVFQSKEGKRYVLKQMQRAMEQEGGDQPGFENNIVLSVFIENLLENSKMFGKFLENI